MNCFFSSCDFDYLEIRDGGTPNAPMVGRFCGETKPGTLKSTGNLMYLRFRTDDSVGHAGFRATYSLGKTVWVSVWISVRNFYTNVPLLFFDYFLISHIFSAQKYNNFVAHCSTTQFGVAWCKLFL